jgi:hypothetical protein
MGKMEILDRHLRENGNIVSKFVYWMKWCLVSSYGYPEVKTHYLVKDEGF